MIRLPSNLIYIVVLFTAPLAVYSWVDPLPTFTAAPYQIFTNIHAGANNYATSYIDLGQNYTNVALDSITIESDNSQVGFQICPTTDFSSGLCSAIEFITLSFSCTRNCCTNWCGNSPTISYAHRYTGAGTLVFNCAGQYLRLYGYGNEPLVVRGMRLTNAWHRCEAGCQCCADGSPGLKCTTGRCYTDFLWFQDYNFTADATQPDCFKCDQTCRTCAQSQFDECLTCHPGSYLWPEFASSEPAPAQLGGVEMGMCIEDSNMTCSAPINGQYYYRGNNPSNTPRCAKCPDFCTSCGDATRDERWCNTCEAGYYRRVLIAGISRDCQGCASDCVTCDPDDGNWCYDCKNDITNQFLEQGTGNCIASCPVGERYQTVGGYHRCQTCNIANCDDCQTDVNTCDECASGYYWDGTACQLCSVLHPQCTQCGNEDGAATANERWCYFCRDDGFGTNMYAQPDQTVSVCASTCPNHYGPTHSGGLNGVCQECTEFDECLECLVNDLSHCESCEPVGHYLDVTVCRDCTDNCDTCTGPNVCDTCATGYLKHDFNPQLCVDDCPQGFVAVGDSCVECDPTLNCLECDTVADSCSACDDDRFLSDYGGGKMECAECDIGCIDCDNDTSCNLCSLGSNFYLNPDTGNCVNDCGDGFAKQVDEDGEPHCMACGTDCDDCQTSFPNCDVCTETDMFISGEDCIPCPTGCASCSGGECDDCSPAWFMFEEEDGTDVCLTHCPVTFRNNNVTNTCDPCAVANCKLCQEEEDGPCDNCIDEYYFDEDTNTCNECIPNCKNCVDDQSCSLCYPAYYFLDDPISCVQDCGDGYRINGLVCQACTDPLCVNCDTNKNICEQCPVGTHFINGANGCSPCEDHCDFCQQDGECTTCETQYYENGTSECTLCPDGCADCDASDDCTSCETDYYHDSADGLCHKCIDNCQQCEDDTGLCESCDEDFFLITNNNTCVEQCPTTNYKIDTDNNRCTKCTDETCLKCESEIDECTSCPDGYFIHVDTKECTLCNNSCATCLSDTYCLDCNAGYFYLSNQCLETCPEDYIPDSEDRLCRFNPEFNEDEDTSDTTTDRTTDEEKAMQEAVNRADDVSTVNDVFVGVAGGVGTPAAILSGGAPQMFEAIGALQVVSFLGAMQANQPEHTNTFLLGMRVTHVNFVPNIFQPMKDSLSRSTGRSLAEDYEIFSQAIFLDDGSMVLGIVVIVLALMILIKLLAGEDGFFKKFKDGMYWNGLIRINLLLFLPLVGYSLIQIGNGTDGSDYNNASLALAIISFVYCAVFYVWMIIILRRKNEDLKNPETYDSYSTLFGKYDYKNSLFAKYFCVIWMTRSWFMGILLAFVKSAPTIQIVFLLIIDLVLLVKIVITKLHLSKVDKFFTIIQQVCIIYCEMVMLVFATNNLTTSAQITLGWSMIVFVMIVICLCLIKIVFDAIKALINLGKKKGKQGTNDARVHDKNKVMNSSQAPKTRTGKLNKVTPMPFDNSSADELGLSEYSDSKKKNSRNLVKYNF